MWLRLTRCSSSALCSPTCCMGTEIKPVFGTIWGDCAYLISCQWAPGGSWNTWLVQGAGANVQPCVSMCVCGCKHERQRENCVDKETAVSLPTVSVSEEIAGAALWECKSCQFGFCSEPRVLFCPSADLCCAASAGLVRVSPTHLSWLHKWTAARLRLCPQL